MSELKKMLAGEMYDPSDHELSSMRSKARSLTTKYNLSRDDDKQLKADILNELFGHIEGAIKIEPHFNCDYGKNIRVC